MKTIKMTDDELLEFASKAKKVYPHIHRDNTVYKAELVSYWNVTVNEELYDFIMNYDK